MNQEFLNRLEQWNEEDKYQEIIDAIEALPEEALDFGLISALARAYNNLAIDLMPPEDRPLYQRAVDLLLSLEDQLEEAVERMVVPLKQFMLRNTNIDTLDNFVRISGTSIEENVENYPLTVVVPSFMTTELKKGFIAGFLIYLPFLLVDIIVSTTLMSMGMVMLPPAMVSLPFKLLLFVTVDGWELLFTSISTAYR